MNALVVGAGAVGQVFGFHLARGGARVSFLVRKSHPLPASHAFNLVRLRRWGRPRPDTLRPDRFFTSPAEVRAEQWDQVWLCVPTPSLEKPWIAALAAATGEATLVFLPASLEIIERIGPPEERSVVGLISLMSRASGPTVTYWLPPLVALVLDGPRQRRDAAVKALRRGGCAAVAGDARKAGAFGSAVLIPHVVALEGAGWSYDDFTHSHWLSDSVAATREASGVAAAHLSSRRPLMSRLVSPWVVRLALVLARWVVPFTLAEFFQAHFTKVRRQSETQLREYIAIGERTGQPTRALRRLVLRIFGGEPLSSGEGCGQGPAGTPAS